MLFLMAENVELLKMFIDDMGPCVQLLINLIVEWVVWGFDVWLATESSSSSPLLLPPSFFFFFLFSSCSQTGFLCVIALAVLELDL